MEAIIHSDIEGLLVGYLSQHMTALVATKVPQERPDVFIKVSRTGGNRVRINAETAVIVVQCWAGNAVEASEIARTAQAYIFALEGSTQAGTWIYKVKETGGLAYNPDPKTGTDRYQFTVSIDTKGRKL